MATRLRVKNRKRIRDMARGYQEGTWPVLHKVDQARSRRAKRRKVARMI